ncbi:MULTISPECIES: HNH endonuclease [unclassified Streptomyces]|uniref:HNH endonuclease n=1 Tax=Streptomyces sp. NPDC056835 TaxID=3345956 RepID=UPI00369D2547
MAGRNTHARQPRASVRRNDLFSRWSAGCCYCDEPAEHVDHVTPISSGGTDTPDNVVPACASCNYDKGARSLAEWAATF